MTLRCLSLLLVVTTVACGGGAAASPTRLGADASAANSTSTDPIAKCSDTCQQYGNACFQEFDNASPEDVAAPCKEDCAATAPAGANDFVNCMKGDLCTSARTCRDHLNTSWENPCPNRTSSSTDCNGHPMAPTVGPGSCNGDADCDSGHCIPTSSGLGTCA